MRTSLGIPAVPPEPVRAHLGNDGFVRHQERLRQFLPRLAIFGNPVRQCDLASAGYETTALAIQRQRAVADGGVSFQLAGGQRAGAIRSTARLEIEPHPRLGPGGFVGAQFGDLPVRQRRVVNPRVGNRAAEVGLGFVPPVQVSQTNQHPSTRREAERILDFVTGVTGAVPVERDRVACIDGRDLHPLAGLGRLFRVVALVPLRAPEIVAAGHPAAGRGLAQHQRIELAGLTACAFHRQHACPLLIELGRRHPGDQRLVANRWYVPS